MLGALITWIIVGVIAGWLAGLIVKGGGFGFVGNLVIGIVGAVAAGYILPAIGFHLGGGLIASIIHAAIGAIIVLVVISVLKRAA
jgi:uncharacterized membrane protein YeaQ/YmgE (transglycosylase-associated protein family)